MYKYINGNEKKGENWLKCEVKFSSWKTKRIQLHTDDDDDDDE